MSIPGKKFKGAALVYHFMVVCLVVAPLCLAAAQQGKTASAKGTVTGRYEGTAKNQSGEIIVVTFELTEKDGAMSGVIHSDHGDFTITGGTHKGDDVTLEFSTEGPTGTINLKLADDKLSGTWSAGEDGGDVTVKKVAAQDAAPKGKS